MEQSIEIAKLLLDIKAVTLNLKQPYRYTSGILSPIYCDSRLIISYPEKRRIIIEAFLNLIEENHLSFNVISGIATAGIPYAAWIADRLNLPMIYVRGKPKSHSKKNQIEGHIEEGQQALIVEDLISTGKSALAAGLVLREMKVIVTDCIAIFSYQLPRAQKNFLDTNINCYILSHFDSLIGIANDAGYINEVEKQKALAWNKDPAHWIF